MTDIPHARRSPMEHERDEPESPYTISSRDLRVGMGIGGWDMEWTVTHNPSGASLTYQTHGSQPRARDARTDALALLAMFVQSHYPDATPTQP